MVTRAKRFYLCNLIPLWEIDERDMEVDWARHHSYFGDLVEMRADVRKRKIRWSADGTTAHPSLRIRFDVYESDFLLSGGRNDFMGSLSSHSGFGDEPTVRPIKIVADVDNVPAGEREQFIFVQWIDRRSTEPTVGAPDGTTSMHREEIPDTFKIRCWWRVVEEEGSDAKGNPEYYYDIYVEGMLVDGTKLDLHERADHELECFSWNVTERPARGRVTPLVDGEYAYIKMLQLMDGAKDSIHILNWKLDPQATLVLEPSFQADYLQLPGIDEASFKGLLARHKPLTLGVAVQNGIYFYTASNGNLVGGLADGSSIIPGIQRLDDPTGVELPAAVEILAASGLNILLLILDELRSRLLLFGVLRRGEWLQSVGRGVHLLAFPHGVTGRFLPLFESRPTFPAVKAEPTAVAGIIPLAGAGNPGHRDGGLEPVRVGGLPVPVHTPRGQLNHPRGLTFAGTTIFIADTGNHCIRRIVNFDPADLVRTLAVESLALETVAGRPEAGLVDGSGAAARFRSPCGLAFDTKAGRLLIADSGNKKLRAFDPATGAVTTLAVASVDDGVATLGEVHGLAFDPTAGSKGMLYLSERDRHRVLALDLDTLKARTVAGSRDGKAGYRDGAAADALFDTPLGLSVSDGALFVADSENRVVRVVNLGLNTVSTIGSREEVGAQDVPVVLADVLRRKAKQGVNVRVLIDGYAATLGDRDQVPSPLFVISGDQVVADLRHYHPSIQAFNQNHEQTTFGQSWGSNHEKLMVVDDRVGVTGGLDFAPDKNDGLVHERRHRFSYFWHDVVALVDGNAAWGLEVQFRRRWQMARAQLEDASLRPDAYVAPDRTDATVREDEVESVRTYDASPFLRSPGASEVREIRESYRRAILAAEHYVYLEHQYIYYEELGDYLEEAMKSNRQLQVIWTIPFFTEESSDPVGQRAQLQAQGALAGSITDTRELAHPAGRGTATQLRSQVAWHGFFRQHEMIKKLRAIDPERVGVFSIQRPFLGQDDDYVTMQMIYPHSKMLLCDDRFVSIGSANANGRGFTRDGEHNVSARTPAGALALRERLWGEHLGFFGVGRAISDGSFVPANGHHLQPGMRVRLRHHRLGGAELEREIEAIDVPTGAIRLQGMTLDPALGRLLWRDPNFIALPPTEALHTWRDRAHSLTTYRKIKGLNATTDASGRLVLPGHIAEVGDRIWFGSKVVRLNEEGESASADPILQPHAANDLEVAAVTAKELTLHPRMRSYPDVKWVAAMAVGQIVFNEETRPFKVKLLSRSAGTARLEFQLAPDQQHVSYDYTASWLLRQPGARRNLRAWEIDPPEGIEYAGPGTVLFSPWFLIPWIFVDFDVDELARLDPPDRDVRVV